jgi:hypothetical protein
LTDEAEIHIAMVRLLMLSIKTCGNGTSYEGNAIALQLLIADRPQEPRLELPSSDKTDVQPICQRDGQ